MDFPLPLGPSKPNMEFVGISNDISSRALILSAIALLIIQIFLKEEGCLTQLDWQWVRQKSIRSTQGLTAK